MVTNQKGSQLSFLFFGPIVFLLFIVPPYDLQYISFVLAMHTIAPAMPVMAPMVTQEKAAKTAVARHPQGAYTPGKFGEVSSVLKFVYNPDMLILSITLIQRLD